MPDTEPAPERVTLYNPVNGLPWECPNTPDSLALWVGEKKFTKTPNKQTPDEFKTAKEAPANG
jgi:hypothetical protein